MNSKYLRDRIRRSRNYAQRTAETTRYQMIRERSLGKVSAFNRVLAMIDSARRKVGAE